MKLLSNLLYARQRFATEVAISLAFATEVAISLAFADAPVYVFYCVLSAFVPRGHLSSQPALCLRINGITPRLSTTGPS
jgi:hypothetical protein